MRRIGTSPIARRERATTRMPLQTRPSAALSTSFPFKNHDAAAFQAALPQIADNKPRWRSSRRDDLRTTGERIAGDAQRLIVGERRCTICAKAFGLRKSKPSTQTTNLQERDPGQHNKHVDPSSASQHVLRARVFLVRSIPLFDPHYRCTRFEFERVNLVYRICDATYFTVKPLDDASTAGRRLPTRSRHQVVRT